MAKFAIIKSSELGDRWDAGFHIAANEVRDRVAVLRATVPTVEAIRRVDALALQDKAPLAVLLRGTVPRLDTESIGRVVREYPHLALALMEKNLAHAVERIRAKLAEDQGYLDALLALDKSDGQS